MHTRQLRFQVWFIALALILTLAGITIRVLTTPATAKAATTPAWANMLPETMRHPCAEEDSVNCYWNAHTAGNGLGHSFIVRQVPGKAHMICVFYVLRADARRWDYCT